jgi:hypothetical protein
MPSPPEEAFIMVKGGWLHGGCHTVSRRKRMTDRHKMDNLSFSNCVKGKGKYVCATEVCMLCQNGW